MIDLGSYIRRGDGVWWGQAAAEATPLVDALLDQVAGIGPCRAFCGFSWNRRLTREPPSELSIVSYGAMGKLRALSRAGRLDVVPAHFSTLPRLFAEGLLPRDVGLVQVSPPGPDGCCTLGIGADYTADALRHTRTVIAEVNRRMPVSAGTERIPLDRFAAVVETDRPLPTAPAREPNETDGAIAAHVAGLVADGDTIQVGVGALPTAVLEALSGHRDLGFHSGLLTDGVLHLVETGVITGRYKEIDKGIAVAGMAHLGTDLYDRLDQLPVEFRPASYTHDSHVLARLRRLVTINAAIEVDLTGQVGAEVAGEHYVGGIGGQADFSGAAARTGARSIIAVRATNGTRSTIVPRLHGPVTTARADVDVVVTEHGAAHLRGCSLAERVRRLAGIAAPEHRDALLAHERVDQ